MYWSGKKFFVDEKDYNNRYTEVNPKDLLPTAIKQVLSAIPANEAAKHNFIADKHFRNEAFAKAVDSYSLAIQSDSNNLHAYYYRGLSLIPLARFNEAVDDFTTLIGHQPDIIEAYFYRANARACIQTYSQIKAAIQDYSAIIDSPSVDDNGKAAAHFGRGYCQVLLKQNVKGFEEWSTAKQLGYGFAKAKESEWKTDYSS